MKKELNSKAMRQWLNKGLRKAKRASSPNDGYFTMLFNETTRNGWHYQVEYLHDERFYDTLMVVVYAWSPKRKEYFLQEKVGKCLTK